MELGRTLFCDIGGGLFVFSAASRVMIVRACASNHGTLFGETPRRRGINKALYLKRAFGAGRDTIGIVCSSERGRGSE